MATLGRRGDKIPSVVPLDQAASSTIQLTVLINPCLGCLAAGSREVGQVVEAALMVGSQTPGTLAATRTDFASRSSRGGQDFGCVQRLACRDISLLWASVSFRGGCTIGTKVRTRGPKGRSQKIRPDPCLWNRPFRLGTGWGRVPDPAVRVPV